LPVGAASTNPLAAGPLANAAVQATGHPGGTTGRIVTPGLGQRARPKTAKGLFVPNVCRRRSRKRDMLETLLASSVCGPWASTPVRTAKTNPSPGLVYPRALGDSAARSGRDRAAMRRLMDAFLEEDSNAIDVGAHEGAMLSEIVRRSPRGQYVAVEPLQDLAARLTARYPTVRVLTVAPRDEGPFAARGLSRRG
jgi:hypothetical protein